MKTVHLLLLCSASIIGCVAQPFPFDPMPLDDAAQDGAGRVWGTREQAGLFYWAEDHWQGQDLVLPGLDTNSFISTGRLPGVRPLFLQTNQQGHVLVFWSRDGYVPAENRYWITRVHGSDRPESSSFQAWLAFGEVSFEPNGTGWLSEAGPRIYRIEVNLAVALSYIISSNQLAGTRFDQYNPVHGIIDGEDRVVFWGEKRFRDLATLRGLLIRSQERFVHYPKIDGLGEEGFVALAIVGPDRLWVSRSDSQRKGLYELSLKNMRAIKLAEPEPSAFDYVTSIFSVGPDVYVVSGYLGLQLPINKLWRWRNGAWQKIISPADVGPFGGFYRVVRPFLADRDGVWIGTGGNGLLLVPHSSTAPVDLFGWRKGQPLENVHQIADLKNGNLLLVGFHEGTTSLSRQDLRKGRTVSGRLIDIWKSQGNLQRDEEGRLWTVFTQPGSVSLAEWNGAEWKHHRLPDDLQNKNGGYHRLGLDSLKRFWVPYGEQRWIAERQETELLVKVAIFLPQSSEWLRFNSLEEALTDLVRRDKRLRVDLPSYYQPDFSSRGEICFMELHPTLRERLVCFYDGKEWQRWDLPSVGFVQPGYPGQPFFTPEGELAINLTKDLRQSMTRIFDGKHWIDGPWRNAGAREPINLHPGLPTPKVVDDKSGGKWIASNQQLFLTTGGLSLPQFDLKDVHPFIGARRVDQVWIDARGNVVLSTSLGPPGDLHKYVVVAPDTAVASSQLNLVKLSPGGVELQFSATERHLDQQVSGGPASAGRNDQLGFIAVESNNALITLRWAGAGVLQAGENVNGPWIDVPGATSPHTILMTNPTEFYRIRR